MRALAVLIGATTVLSMGAKTNAAYTVLGITAVNSTVTLDPTVPSLTNIAVTRWRVWANFTRPNDALYAWGGGGNLGPATINNLGPSGTSLGTGFLNDVEGGLLPPASNAAVGARDSYFTIGVTVQNQIPAGQGISLMSNPGNPPDVSGVSINLSNGGGVITQETTSAGTPNPIALAGFTGDGDPILRILVMQLVVRAGENVNGTIGLTVNNGSLAGATTTFQNQHFGIPAPAGWIMLSLAAFASCRRRRAI